MVGYAHRRHWVEQYHEEAKGLWGWDQYQGRLGTGFHREEWLGGYSSLKFIMTPQTAPTIS